MIHVTDRIAIDEREIEESFVRASGPGGQNVNKVSSAVRLRFDVRASPSLPPDVKARLERLVALVREAAIPPVPRRETRVPNAERRRRREHKRRRGLVKKLRGGLGDEA